MMAVMCIDVMFYSKKMYLPISKVLVNIIYSGVIF